MRPFLVAVGLLCLAALALAIRDDAACVIYSNDCQTCVKNDCSWCADGYCASSASSICPSKNLFDTCTNAVSPLRHSKRDPCSGISDCTTCLATAGCSLCKSSTGAVQCSDSPSCSDPYENPTFSIPTSTCEVQLTLSPTSPTLTLPGMPAASIYNATTGQVDTAAIQSYISSYLTSVLGEPIPADAIIVISVTLADGTVITVSHGRRDAASLLKVTFGFADVAGVASAQQLAATLTSAVATTPLPAFPGTTTVPGQPSLAPGSIAISVHPLTPAAGTGQVVAKSHSNNDLNLSKGALAGIIIGCIIGGALLVALIVIFFVRRRDSYPMAFRSPAAAYRP